MSAEKHVMKETIEHYKQEAEAELHRIMEFWKTHAPDEMHGGFIGQMDQEGHVVEGAPKGCILNARILWTFSTAFWHTGKPEFFLLARRAYHYLVDHFYDRDFGGLYWSLDAKGNPLDTRKQIYALAFGIYGLSEYYRVSGEAKALVVCKDLFRWIEKFSFDAVNGGYLEAFSREGGVLDDVRLSPIDRNEPKTMNTHLHVLEAYAGLYRCWPDMLLGARLKALIRVFLDKIIDERSGHMNLFFSTDWKVAAEIVSYGHDIEASWLLFEAAEVLGDEALLEEVAEKALALAHASIEGLQADGSLYHEFDQTGGHYDMHREWWVSAEAMVGFLNAYQRTGEEAYLDKSLGAWRFAQAHLLDLKKGEWFRGVNADYSVMEDQDKVGFWKCPYHNSRACIEVMNRCEKIIENMIEGRVVGAAP